MRNVLFVAPYPTPTTFECAARLARLRGVRLLGIFQQSTRGLAARGFSDAVVVQNTFDPAQLVWAARALEQKWGRAHRILGLLEDMQEPVAAARQALGLPGAHSEEARRFRDKAHMKRVLGAAGIPVARHRRVESAHDAFSFAHEVGFPLVLKPLSGAGAKATWRVSAPWELARAIDALKPSASNPGILEEFLTGEEYSMEAVVLNGRPVFWSFSHYLPSPLQVTENPHLQWCVVLPRDVNGPLYERAWSLGRATIAALGMKDGTTHMEWFQRPDGSLAVGEIAMRPPGAQLGQMTSIAHDRDFLQDWARAHVDGTFEGHWKRNWAVGTAFLRGTGAGRIHGLTGVAAAHERVKGLVVDHKLPKVGAHRRGGYEGDGWVMVRHETTRGVVDALRALVSTIKVHDSAPAARG